LCACHDLRLAERLRVRKPLLIVGERLLGVSAQKQGRAPVGETAFANIVAAEDERLPAVPLDVVDREPPIDMGAGRLEIAGEEVG
jgi:hypothetical protein